MKNRKKVKGRKSTFHLNGYKIYWAITINKEGKVILMDHFKDKEKALKNYKKIINTTTYFITDKQFGMIQNSWKPNVWKPVKALKQMNVINKCYNQSIPLTTYQIENRVLN